MGKNILGIFLKIWGVVFNLSTILCLCCPMRTGVSLKAWALISISRSRWSEGACSRGVLTRLNSILWPCRWKNGCGLPVSWTWWCTSTGLIGKARWMTWKYSNWITICQLFKTYSIFRTWKRCFWVKIVICWTTIRKTWVQQIPILR